MPRRGAPRRPSKYQPLADFLATQEGNTVRLTFPQIAALIGGPLPVSAFVALNYWHQIGRPMASALRAVGWTAQRIEYVGGAVVFTRVPGEG